MFHNEQDNLAIWQIFALNNVTLQWNPLFWTPMGHNNLKVNKKLEMRKEVEVSSSFRSVCVLRKVFN